MYLLRPVACLSLVVRVLMQVNRLYSDVTPGATGLLLSLFIIAASFAMTVRGVSKSTIDDTNAYAEYYCVLGRRESDTRFIRHNLQLYCEPFGLASGSWGGEKMSVVLLHVVTSMICVPILAQEKHKEHKQFSW